LRKIPDSVMRLSIVLAATVVSLVAIRFFVLPASLTDMGAHKTRAMEHEAAKEIRFAGSAVCADCHVEEPGKIVQGYHSLLSCETCHGPAQAHVEDLEIKPTAPRKREFCPVCHTYDRSRPTGFPQINPVAHNPLEPCIQCHDPHDPKPPETPRECSACHAEIARTKAISHHVGLACTTCHVAPDQHRVTPRTNRATKPAGRQFCGTCHGEDSENKGSLKVDLATHGGRYQCWQCHYPHLPEES